MGQPDTFAHWSERKVSEMVRKQTRLLHAAIVATRPGGTIVYSTCSLAPEENEGVVDQILKRHENKVRLEEIEEGYPNSVPGIVAFRGKSFAPEISRTIRVLPDDNQHAFFVAKFTRLAS